MMKKWLEEKGIGHEKVNYKLRDWVFSPPAVLGEPIPLVHCDKCGWVPSAGGAAPLLLPEVSSYEPTDNGESPLATMTDWVNTTCPCCGGPAQRRPTPCPSGLGLPGTSCGTWIPTTTRPWPPRRPWVLGPGGLVQRWNGAHHPPSPLLRFWHKFLYDLGVVPYANPITSAPAMG